MAYDKRLLRNVISEMQQVRDGERFVPTPDIEMVWVLSSLGTYSQEASDGAYSGVSFDRMNIEAGIEAVRAITAVRLGKTPETVTKDDIEKSGPTLFYNGEDANTAGVNYLQNDALRSALNDPDFPLPVSKVIIDHIDTIGTPAQVTGFAKYAERMRESGLNAPQKVAVVSLAAHSTRVGRYLQRYREELPQGTQFVSVPVAEGDSAMGAAVREAKRILTYEPLGHLSSTSAFDQREPMPPSDQQPN